MRKWTWSALVLAAVLVVAGCGAKNDNAGNGGNEGAASPSASAASPSASGEAGAKFKIAISQIVEHPSLDATREGFLAALKDAGVEADIDYNNAQDDPANNGSIAKKIASGDSDLVLAISTPSALAVVSEVKDVPVLFAAVTDPLASKLVSDLQTPGGNVSGASDTNPEATTKLVEFIAAHFPNIKTVGLVINEGEENAVVMAAKAEEELSKKGIKLIKAPIANTSEVKQAAESLVKRVDAFYITLDNKVVSGVDAILNVAKANKKPFFSSDRDTVEKGALATVGFKYYDHGYQAGQMAVEVLKNGKKPADMAVAMQEKLDLILNAGVAADYGVTITEEMKKAVADQEQNLIP